MPRLPSCPVVIHPSGPSFCCGSFYGRTLKCFHRYCCLRRNAVADESYRGPAAAVEVVVAAVIAVVFVWKAYFVAPRVACAAVVCVCVDENRRDPNWTRTLLLAVPEKVVAATILRTPHYRVHHLYIRVVETREHIDTTPRAEEVADAEDVSDAEEPDTYSKAVFPKKQGAGRYPKRIQPPPLRLVRPPTPHSPLPMRTRQRDLASVLRKTAPWRVLGVPESALSVAAEE